MAQCLQPGEQPFPLVPLEDQHPPLPRTTRPDMLFERFEERVQFVFTARQASDRRGRLPAPALLVTLNADDAVVRRGGFRSLPWWSATWRQS